MDMKTVSIRCEDGAESVTFLRCDYGGRSDYEMLFEDAYCGGNYRGVFGRLKRAWKAFWSRPVYYSSIYVMDEARIKKFLQDCMDLVDAKEDSK